MSETAGAEATAAAAQPPDGIPARFVRRIALVATTWILAGWAIVGAFVWPDVPGHGWTLLAIALLSLAPLPVLLRGFVGRSYPSAWTRVLVLRPFLYVFLFLPLVALATLAAALVGLLFGGAMVAGRVAALAAAALLALLAVAGYVGSKRLVVRHVEVAHPALPPQLDGLRIVQLSDLHVGPHTSRRFLARVVREVERARPDVVAHTGDQVDDYDRDVAHFVRALGSLDAPLGVYAIAGNHDIYAGWEGVRDGLAAAGVRVLVNEAVPVERGGASLWLAGTGDPAATQWGVADPLAPAPDLDRTMAAVPPGAFAVVLAHNPALWPGLAQRGAQLTLSGHTHHGQLSIPALKWCLASPFLEHAMGRYDEGGRTLYINPGTNYWGLPLRLGAWPEVTVVTLRSGPAA